MTSQDHGEHSQPPVKFTIDGEQFQTDDRSQPAATLLTAYAHLDPANYDLAELHGGSTEPKVFADDDTVHIHPGARYVSLRTGPGPVE